MLTSHHVHPYVSQGSQPVKDATGLPARKMEQARDVKSPYSDSDYRGESRQVAVSRPGARQDSHPRQETRRKRSVSFWYKEFSSGRAGKGRGCGIEFFNYSPEWEGGLEIKVPAAFGYPCL